MTYKELLQAIEKRTQLPEFVIGGMLNVLAAIIKDELAKGENVQIDFIGTFHVVDSNNMNGKKRVKLKPHAVLKAAINEELNE